MLFSKLIEKKFIVEGNHCNKCKANVENALNSIPGVKKVKVELDGNVVIKSKEVINEEVIKEKIEDAGFSVVF